MTVVRAAMNAVPGGQSVLLSTEGFADLYNLHGVSTNKSNPHCSLSSCSLITQVRDTHSQIDRVCRALR
jgi:hypothetical protein